MSLEARVAKIESDVVHMSKSIDEIKSDLKEVKSDMKSDFRWTLGMFIALVGVMAHGFHWI